MRDCVVSWRLATQLLPITPAYLSMLTAAAPCWTCVVPSRPFSMHAPTRRRLFLLLMMLVDRTSLSSSTDHRFAHFAVGCCNLCLRYCVAPRRVTAGWSRNREVTSRHKTSPVGSRLSSDSSAVDPRLWARRYTFSLLSWTRVGCPSLSLCGVELLLLRFW